MRDGLGLALGLDAKEVGAVSQEQCPVGHGRGCLEGSVELIGDEYVKFSSSSQHGGFALPVHEIKSATDFDGRGIMVTTQAFLPDSFSG